MTDVGSLIGFSLATLTLPIAQAMANPVTEGARTLEQSTPTFVLAVVCIVFSIAIVRLNQRNEKITEKLLVALTDNTAAVTAVRTVVDECHRKTVQ